MGGGWGGLEISRDPSLRQHFKKTFMNKIELSKRKYFSMSCLFKYYVSILGGWGVQAHAYYADMGGWGVWNNGKHAYVILLHSLTSHRIVCYRTSADKLYLSQLKFAAHYSSAVSIISKGTILLREAF